jgi:hypothetical protein
MKSLLKALLEQMFMGLWMDQRGEGYRRMGGCQKRRNPQLANIRYTECPDIFIGLLTKKIFAIKILDINESHRD